MGNERIDIRLKTRGDLRTDVIFFHLVEVQWWKSNMFFFTNLVLPCKRFEIVKSLQTHCSTSL